VGPTRPDHDQNTGRRTDRTDPPPRAVTVSGRP
jgi:hypothetical protein